MSEAAIAVIGYIGLPATLLPSQYKSRTIDIVFKKERVLRGARL